MGCLWGMGMSIMGCEVEGLGRVLIMGWPWEGRGDELLWDVSVRAKRKKLAKDSYYGMSGVGIKG